MKTASATWERLVSAACMALEERGLAALTVASVASRAGVSTALVHYHFDTKGQLLLAAAARLAAARSAHRLDALGRGTGLRALDDVWEMLLGSAESGEERAYLELALLGLEDDGIAAALAEDRSREHAALGSRLPALLADLGANPVAGIEELVVVVTAAFDGFTLALLYQPAASVRAAYDAFWLTMISAGQAAARR
jgi:AcrR family transcriptional regulator